MPDVNEPDTAKTPDTDGAKGTSSLTDLKEHVKPISLERLIQGFPLYFKTAREVVLRPTAFVTALDVNKEGEFGKAIEFASYSIVIFFVLLIPTFIAHDEKISKLTFFARSLTLYAICGALMHLALKVMGSRNVRLKGTATVYAYLVGVGAPLCIACYYPVFLIIGPKVLFETPADADKIGDVLSQNADVLSQNMWLLPYLIFIRYAYFIYTLVLTIKLFSKSHMISGLRVSLAVFLAGIVIVPLDLQVLNPLFNIVFAWADKVISYL